MDIWRDDVPFIKKLWFNTRLNRLKKRRSRIINSKGDEFSSAFDIPLDLQFAMNSEALAKHIHQMVLDRNRIHELTL